jgi:hypothetical protein
MFFILSHLLELKMTILYDQCSSMCDNENLANALDNTNNRSLYNEINLRTFVQFQFIDQ